MREHRALSLADRGEGHVARPQDGRDRVGLDELALVTGNDTVVKVRGAGEHQACITRRERRVGTGWLECPDTRHAP